MVCSSNNPSDTSDTEKIEDLTTEKTGKSQDLVQNATSIEGNEEAKTNRVNEPHNMKYPGNIKL